MFGRGKKASVQIPGIEIPSVELGGGRLPRVETPNFQTPRLDLELMAQAPLVRRRRRSPILQAFKLVLGVGVGLAVGCLVAALLAPAAGEDTRRKLGELAQGIGGARSAVGRTPSAPPAASDTVRQGIVGLLANPRARFQLALEEARREREAKERELMAEFESAKRTGSSPT